MNGIEPPLRETLDHIARDCRDLSDPWWLIGSAAARLLGLDGPVRDVDLLVSDDDAATLLARWKLAPLAPEPSLLFRSRLFARWSALPLDVELMAGFEVRGKPLVPVTQVRIEWSGAALFVPDVCEQIAICRRFGRAKDLERAERLERL